MKLPQVMRLPQVTTQPIIFDGMVLRPKTLVHLCLTFSISIPPSLPSLPCGVLSKYRYTMYSTLYRYIRVYLYVPLYTYIYTSIYLHIPLYTYMYLYIPPYTSICLYIPIYTSMYLYIPPYTSMYLSLSNIIVPKSNFANLLLSNQIEILLTQ